MTRSVLCSLTLGIRALLITLLAMTLSADANPQSAAPPGGGNPAPAAGGTNVAQVWNTFIPLLGFAFTASTFTPDAAITVTRIQAQVAVAPSNCKTNAVLQVSNTPPAGTAPTVTTLTITSAANDSGSIAVHYAAGIPITISVSIPAQCGWGPWPSLANVVVQYSTPGSGGAAPAPAAPAA